ncbi:MAG TPA: hypothetical protein VJR89_18440 [Polyangiales bacterium]|nr:hypothetical protein [Polyangiales bacterium]
MRFALGLLVLAACAAPEPTPPSAAARWADALAALPRGAEQLANVCGRAGDDAVRDVFCAEHPPEFASLGELQVALGVDPASVQGFSSLSTGKLTALAITGNSTGLATRSVSAINPRLIALRVDIRETSVLALAFARGEQMAELVVRDRVNKDLNFYVVGFRQACNATGCTPGDLFTPAIERDWTELSLYDEHDLQNTVLDCATCHQPAGPGTPKRLLMQEFNAPWTHWFWKHSDGGQALLADYFAAKSDEPYAGMSAAQIESVDPNTLTAVIILLNPSQTGSFDSTRIETEVGESGDSVTWREAYERAKRGELIPLPYPDVKVSDPQKLAQLTAAYQAYRRGELAADELPDLRDVFPDDPVRLAQLGVSTEPGLDGRGVLLQACSQCHRAGLDPMLSRARFRADLVGMSRGEKDLAIARLRLPPDDPRAMPPARLRVLSDEARSRAIAVLREP